MPETIRYTRLGKEDLNLGTGTFEARLADGRVVTLSQIDLGDIVSDAALSTPNVTLDTLTLLLTPSARGHAMTLGNVQDGTGVYVATVGGTADAITLTPTPAITTYTAGQTFYFIASGNNTTAVTVNISGLGIKNVTKLGNTALVADDIASGAVVMITYDGTRFILAAIYRQCVPINGGTMIGNLLFTDATYDIGASGATRPRNLFLSNNVTVGNAAIIPNEGLKLFDTNSSHALIIKPGSDLGSDRILTLTTGDAARTVTLNGDVSLTHSQGLTTIVASTSFPSANSVSITDIPQTHAGLLLVVNGVSLDTATRNVRIQVSTDNGSSFDTTIANYAGSNFVQTVGAGANTLEASLFCFESVNQTAAQTGTWTLWMTGYQNGAYMMAAGAGVSATLAVSSQIAHIGSTTAMNAMRIILNGTGNFDGGTYALFGVN